MEILERKEDPKKYLLMVTILFVVMVSDLQRLEVAYPYIWVSILVGLGVWSWFRFGNKPSAWVQDDILYIWN